MVIYRTAEKTEEAVQKHKEKHDDIASNHEKRTDPRTATDLPPDSGPNLYVTVGAFEVHRLVSEGDPRVHRGLDLSDYHYSVRVEGRGLGRGYRVCAVLRGKGRGFHLAVNRRWTWGNCLGSRFLGYKRLEVW